MFTFIRRLFCRRPTHHVINRTRHIDYKLRTTLRGWWDLG